MPIAPLRPFRPALKNVPLRWVLTAPFVVLTIGAVTLVGYLSYRSGQAAAESLGQQFVTQTNDRVMQELKMYLQTPLLINRLNVDVVHRGQLDLQDTSALESTLFARSQQFDQVSAILFADPQGMFRLVERLPDLYLVAADPPRSGEIRVYRLNGDGSRGGLVTTQTGLDVRHDRPWYRRAVATGQPGWNAISQYGSQELLTLNVSHPVYDSTNQLLGVFAVHIRLDYLSEFLHALDISRSGQVFIVDQRGNLIATSTLEKLYQFVSGTGYHQQFEQLKIDESHDDLTRSLGNYLYNQTDILNALDQPQTLELSHNGELHFVKVTPFQDEYGLDWRIVTVIPKSYFLGAIQENINRKILLSLLVLGMAISLGLIAANRLISRFSQFNRVSREIAAGDFSQRLPIDSPIYELNDLAQAFNQMVDQLQQSFDRIQTALEESEEKFTTIFRNSPDPMAIASFAEERVLEVNDSLIACFGYSRAEMLSQSAEIRLWCNLNQRQQYKILLQQHGSIRNLEAQLRTKSGVVKTVLLSAEVRTLEGQDCVIVVLRDISERKQAEIALQRYERIVSATTDAISLVDRQYCYQIVNQTYLEWNHKSYNEIVGHSIGDLIGQEVFETVAQPYLDRCFAGETIQYSEWFDLPKLGRQFLNITYSPYFETDQTISGVVVSVRNITSLKQAEVALQESEERFQEVAQTISQIVYVLSATTGQYLYINPAFEQIWGDPCESLFQNPRSWLDRVHPEDLDEVLQVLNGLYSGDKFCFDYRIIRPDDEIRWVRADSSIVKDENGNPLRIIGLVEDITDRKTIELALKQSEALTRAILDALPDLIIRMHRDGTYLYVKPTTAFPIEFPNLRVGENIRNILPTEEAQRRLAASTTALQTGKIQVYEFPLCVQGQHLWQEARVMPLDVDEVLVVIRDLTQRKQMEESLRQSEARLAMAQRVAQMGNWECDLESQTIFCSEATLHHWGLDSSQPKPGLAELLQRVHLDDREILQQSFKAAITKGTPYTLDLRVVQPDGSIRYLDSRAEPLFNVQGQVVKLIGTSLDITARKQTEQALQEREAMLRAIGDNLPKGFIYQRIYEPGKGYSYSYVSAGVERLLGLKPEEILADPKAIRTIGFEEDLAHADYIVQESLKHLTPIELQMRNRAAKGEIQWSAIRSTPRRLADGRTVWDGVEVDITDLKRTEAALRASEELLRSAFDNAPIGISLVSTIGKFVKVNPCYCDLLGYTEEELLSLTFQEITHPADLEIDLVGFQQMMAGEIRSLQIEKRYLTKQGIAIPVLMNAALIRDHNGQPLYCVGQVQDIRDRLKVERMKDEFISVVSHELRTPLTSIRGALGILGSGVFDQRPEQAKHMLNIAINNSDRLVRLVDDILTLERLASGKVQLVREQCQVADLMRQAVDSVQTIADQSNITLSLLPLSATVWASSDAIIQTLTNLLSNAIKFSSAGDTVWVKADHSSLPTPSIRFSVKDQGRGIPEDKLETIFEQFQQVDVSDSRKKGGTGLGLTICKDIVQQHGGKIWVKSRLGEGSTFYFTLPLVMQGEDDAG
jgi:PAS domain S-box-containing protein